jgi:hypothetical protein
MWDLKIDTRRLVEGFSTSVPWDRPNVLWNKADDWWNDNYVTDSNTAAFLSATGIIDPNKQNYINNLVIALKNQGIWNKAKAIYPFVSEQRNLLNNTDTFLGWSLEGGVLTSGFTDPLGGNTAYKYVHNSSQGLWANQTFTEASTTYTQSIWVKSVSGANVNFILSSGNGPTGQVNLTATGTWQRVTNTSFFDAGGSLYLRNVLDAAGIYVWHPQVELGNLTDYQVTINAQEQFAAAYKYNLKDPQDTDAAFRLKIFGSWTFTPTGAKPNGTNAYMDTNFLPSTSYLNNNTHISVYSRTNASGPSACVIGTATNSNATPLITIYARDSIAGYIMDAYNYTNNRITTSSTLSSAAFFINSRTSSTVFKSFRNGTQLGTTNSSTNSNNITTCDKAMYIGALNYNGSAAQFSNYEQAFSSIGDGLTDAEAATLYTIVQQFQTALNRQV